MAVRTTIVLSDDLDGGTDNVATHHFDLDGVRYEIDLSRVNHDRMTAAIAPFIAAARRTPKARSSGPQDGRAHHARIRQWWTTSWRTHNLPEPKATGAIPKAVLTAYRDNR